MTFRCAHLGMQEPHPLCKDRGDACNIQDKGRPGNLGWVIFDDVCVLQLAPLEVLLQSLRDKFIEVWRRHKSIHLYFNVQPTFHNVEPTQICAAKTFPE